MSNLNKYFVIFASLLFSFMLFGFALATPLFVLTSNDIYGLTDPANALSVVASNGILNNDGVGIMSIELVGTNNTLYGKLYEFNQDGSFVYITNSDSFHGVDSFFYIASDGVTNSSSTRVVIGVNDTAPVAVEDRYSVPSGSLIIDNLSGVLANDSDFDLDTIYSTLVQDVHNGSLNLSSDGSFNYTANKSKGVDFFQYLATDLYLNSNTVYSIIVVGNNTAPTATADIYNYNLVNNTFEVNATEGLLANDNDLERDNLFARLVDDSSLNGTLNFYSDGSFTYYPSTGKQGRGIETFTYYTTDLDLNSSTKTVKIYVNYSDPVVETPTPSQGGGRAGNCPTQWNCSTWSNCSNGLQTRVCSYSSKYCTPTLAKPLQEQTCILLKNGSNTNQTNNSSVIANSTTQGVLAGLTGAVIGTTVGRISFGVLIFLILVGLVYWIVKSRRKMKEKLIIQDKKK